jgi:hypothetical protein
MMSGQMTNPRFRFYEVVRIRDGVVDKPEIAGAEGAILGMARELNGDWSYGVYLYERGHVAHLSEDELEPTGRMDSRESFYSGESVAVEVNPITGEGRVSSQHSHDTGQ